jgi:hypothetical protein
MLKFNKQNSPEETPSVLEVPDLSQPPSVNTEVKNSLSGGADPNMTVASTPPISIVEEDKKKNDGKSLDDFLSDIQKTLDKDLSIRDGNKKKTLIEFNMKCLGYIMLPPNAIIFYRIISNMNTNISESMLKRICKESFAVLVSREYSSICAQLLQPELMGDNFKRKMEQIESWREQQQIQDTERRNQGYSRNKLLQAQEEQRRIEIEFLKVANKENARESFSKLREYGDKAEIYELLMDEQDNLLDELEDQKIDYGNFYSKDFEYVEKKGFDEIDNMIMVLSKLRVTLLVKKNYD